MSWTMSDGASVASTRVATLPGVALSRVNAASIPSTRTTGIPSERPPGRERAS